ncbi:uncharacterized protein LOC18426860 isoform X2 [Amborella trichopoda]|uniref:uncharacterized protein LOC18426860 isoform X2 n=1 Tax=Amborella trichopoda TaxID=13333 RepID=UPI0009C0D3F2|nr:uncharacterized protein LOC18426860 isoform X2 [Amborella trichopoda]|eukprot:XP_020518381.1 uncharacterized protein LOC18426860 isoform X2 [Amborella trichopoda]
MAEGTKVRLVRCPKCEKLLPEIAEYPVYRCGGCGAILQAKNQVYVTGNHSSEEVREIPVGCGENQKDFEENGAVPLGRSNSFASDRGDKKNSLNMGFPNERFNGHSSDEFREEGRDVSDDFDGRAKSNGKVINRSNGAVTVRNQINQQVNTGEKMLGSEKEKSDKSGPSSYVRCETPFGNGPSSIACSENPAPNASNQVLSPNTLLEHIPRQGYNNSGPMKVQVQESHGPDDCEMASGFYDYGADMEHRNAVCSKATMGNWETEGLNSNINNLNIRGTENGCYPNKGGDKSHVSQDFQHTRNWRAHERVEKLGYQRNDDGFSRYPRNMHENVHQHWLYPDEGPSYSRGNASGYADPILHGLNSVECLERDRLQLLRKLDELRDQLSGSCDVPDRPRDPQDPYDYDGPGAWFREEPPPSRSNWATRNHLRQNIRTHSPSHNKRESELNMSHPVPLMDKHDMELPHQYPRKYSQNEIPRYREPFDTHMPGRTIPQSIKFSQRPFPRQGFSNGRRHQDEFLSGEMDLEPLVSYPYPSLHNNSMCSCYHCYNRNNQRAHIPSSVAHQHRISGAPNGHIYNYHFGPSTHMAPHNYVGTRVPFHLYNLQRRERRPTDLEPELFRGGQKWNARRVILRKDGVARKCRPIASGAPFITCSYCYQLLQLPRKAFPLTKDPRKLRCGACSSVLSFSVQNNNHMVFLSSAQDNTGGSSKEGLSFLDPVNLSEARNLTSNISHEVDYDISTYNIQSGDTDPVSSSFPIDIHCVMGKEDVAGHLPKQIDRLKDRLNCTSEQSNKKQDLPSFSGSSQDGERSSLKETILGSPLHKHLEHSSPGETVTTFNKRNGSKRANMKTVVPSSNGTSRQNSMKEELSAAMTDSPPHNDLGCETSPESVEEMCKEYDLSSKTTKGSDSFLAGLIKRSFRDLTRSENSKPNVMVNGKPIPNRLVRKAEKQAGPIHPGDYWYDYRAGFWGVMGWPCLGIIPPCIEEFNFPMSKSCSGGNTGIFVNGRELHQKDLELLSGRGLPTTLGKAYIIEISGSVIDEASREELDGLGKLAPTLLSR